MNDYTILENLFKNEQDEIHFDLFKESNVMNINNNNGDCNNFDNGISFNTQSIASKMINYSDAYVLLTMECEIPFDETDQGKKSIPKLLYLKNSFEIVKNIKVQLNDVTILNEGNVNRSALIDYVLDNSQGESLMYRNIKKASSDSLNITDNKFITKDTYFKKQEDSDEEKNHFIDFEIPILNANKTGLNYDMPSIKFNDPHLLIDNVRFENSIPNDISAYKALKNKSMYSNNFIINYDDYINYYRIYFWNISRQIKDKQIC